MIKIAIADDHLIVREGLKQLLSLNPTYNIIGEYSNGTNLLNSIKVEEPDVIFLDIQMPENKGDEVLIVIKELHPNIKVIILTSFDTEFYLNKLIGNGANGYLLKTINFAIINQAIETVLSGGTFIDPSLESELKPHHHIAFKKPNYKKLALTPQERAIAKLLAQGDSNQEIAQKLFKSLHTIRNHRARIFLKLDVSTISQLVKKVMEEGI